MNDEFYMNLALKKAWEFQILTYPNPAVGCVITDKNGAILACEAHEKAGLAHAELNAVRSALARLNPSLKFPKNPNELYEFIMKNHGDLLKGARAYVTLEPCSHQGKTPPCARLLASLKFSEAVIAKEDDSKEARGGAQILKEAGVGVKFGVLKEEAQRLLEPFLSWQGENFSFFKLALTSNGVATGGIISNEASRAHMHALRAVSDLLVVGGNTVRIDRPTLDTRLVGGGKNPNVLIYSKAGNFDRSIPLFSVPNRSAQISSSLESAFAKGLTMFEGGENFLRNLDPRIKWILIYRSSEFKDAPNLRLNLRLAPLFSAQLGDGSYAWFRRADGD